MLVLTFQVDRVVYAVPARRVIAVVPRVELRRVPHAPDCFLGLLHYRGGAVPVVDLGLLMGRSVCVDRLDTRIVLVHGASIGLGPGEGDEPLGLVAERVNDLIEVDASHAAMRDPAMADAPYLGPVYEAGGGLLQLLDPGRIKASAMLEARGAIAP